MDNRLRRVVGERETGSKKSRSSDQSVLSNGNNSFGVQDRPKFKKGNKHSGNPTPSKKTNSKKGNDRNSQRDRNPCDKCGRLHGGECLVGTNIFYGCGKSRHMVMDCPHMTNKARRDAQPRPNTTSAAEPPKRN